MNFTTLPRQLVYTNRQSLDDFDIDSDESVDAVFFERLSTLSGLNDSFVGIEKTYLNIFNDAYYICTLLMMERRPQLCYYDFLRIANQGFEFMGIPNLRTVTVLSMVSYLLKHVDGQLPKNQNLAKQQIDDYLDSVQNKIQVVFYAYNMFAQRPKIALARLAPCKITPTTLVGIDWQTCTDGYKPEKIRELVVSLGKCKEEQLLLIESMEEAVKKAEAEQLPF